MGNEFNVMDMIDDYASENGLDAEDIFKSEEKPEEKVEKKAAPGEWRPDASITKDMEEFNDAPVVYDKKDVIIERKIVNGADEQLEEDADSVSKDMALKERNIEEAKARHGITKLQIPPGELQTRFLIAASERSHDVAQAKLDELFKEVETTYPDMILERVSDVNNKTDEAAAPETDKSEDTIEGVDVPESNDNLKIVIDKSKVSELSWSQEEVDKIKKSRTLELNIVESADLEMGSIEEADDNAIDAILSTYQKKTNDLDAPLPASKYRATFFGLTYPEVIDLTSANTINNIDGERLKWSIVFNHMKNVSIGPWKEYYLYIDPVTRKECKVYAPEDIPANVADSSVHYVSRYEDFLRNTSFMDLKFCLWKILCATSMEKEVVSIDCHSKNENGKECGNKYDWIYAPNELLDTGSIAEAVLEEMKETAEASSVEDAIKVHKMSPVMANNYVELPSSKMKVIYGHISAYDYLEDMYPKLKELQDSDNTPDAAAKVVAFDALTVVKAVLVPNNKGGYTRIRGISNLEKVLSTFNEIDFSTIEEIKRMMSEPYDIKFSMRNIVCPKCKNRSMIPIDDMANLLFIIARSLSSVEVTLKRI